MKLMAVATTGADIGSWLHPESENNYLSGAWWADIARTLEKAKFDAIFFADSQALPAPEALRKGGDVYLLDPVPLAATIAAHTSKIGIGVTISSTLVEPYAIARSMGTLDVLSGGRMAWNVVTSSNDSEARKYGDECLPSKSERYDRADETVDAVCRLWNSFPREAYVVDQDQEVFVDPDRLDHFQYRGKYVATEGPLSVPQSPQNHPVIMQAGSSPRGRDFAARSAEVIFTYQRSAEGMQAFREDMNERFKAAGRSPEECAIVPSIQVIVGETTEIALARRDYMYSLIDEGVARARVSMYIGMDLTEIDGDATLDDIDRSLAAAGGSQDVFFDTMRKEGLTLSQAVRKFAFNDMGPEVIGSPEEVADMLQEMFETWGCDGFMLNAGELPSSFEEVARSVVPLLQERGVFRRDYEGTTLRSHLAQKE